MGISNPYPFSHPRVTMSAAAILYPIFPLILGKPFYCPNDQLNPLPRLKPGDSQRSYKLSMALIREDYSIHSLTYNRTRINERTALALDSRESKAGRTTLPIAVCFALEIASLRIDSIPCQSSFALANIKGACFYIQHILPEMQSTSPSASRYHNKYAISC